MIEQVAKSDLDIIQNQIDLEAELHRTEEEISELFSNSTFLVNAIEGYILNDTIQKYIDKPYTVIIYNDNDSIIYWNNNKTLPFKSHIQYTDKASDEKYELAESIYLKKTRPYEFKIDGKIYYYNLVALIPTYKHYSITNNYLQDYFPLMPIDFSKQTAISKKKNNYSIKDKAGNTLLYVKAQENSPHAWYILFAGLLYLLGSIGLILFLYTISAQIAKRRYLFTALGTFVLGVSFLRLLSIFYDFPRLAYDYRIFNYRVSDTNNTWLYSLGDFLIDMTLLTITAIFIGRELQKNYLIPKEKKQRLTLVALNFGAIFGGISFLQFAVRDIISSSYLSFNFDNFAQIETFTFWALLGIGMLTISQFFIAYYTTVATNTFKVSPAERIMSFGGVLLLTVVAITYFEFPPIDILLICFFGAVQLLLLYRYTQNKATSLAWVSIWILFFAALLTLVIENANADKKINLRKDYAKALAFERDLNTENIFNVLAPQIMTDGSLKISLNNPLSPSPRRQAVNLLTYRYLDNYFFGKYDYSAHIYTNENKEYRGEERPYDEIATLLRYSYKTNSEFLSFYSNPSGNFSYIAKIPLYQGESLLGYIVIELTPKKSFQKSNIYVELLSRNKDRLENIFADYTYALYKFDSRVATNGSIFKAELPYNFPKPKAGSFLIIKATNDGQFNYLLYRDKEQPNNISIIQLPRFNFYQSISVFAYLFCFGLFLLLSVQLVDVLFRQLTKKELLQIKFENSLREQIQKGILLVTLSSFIAIALITILYYRYDYMDYHKSRLLRKVTTTAKTASWQLNQSQDSIIKLPDAKELADIHKIDVNIYALNGDLISSSEKVIFERHLISKKMNPSAFIKLKQEQQSKVIQSEIINEFEYLSAYVPLKDKEGNTIAFLNLPYDLASNTNLGSQDVIKFLGALLNVYVLFLLLAGVAAFIIAGSVTNPLSVIGEKLDKVQLGQKNEPIEWKNKDEIGELVERYNHMIKELEENTKKLTRSQRESAWREMAKQVAHEIKNPLTPMKLNIQLLQRVVNTKPEKAQKMVNRVASALIEQIDSLAHIASEFSNFAKMPTANNEKLHLNTLVSNAYELFREEENMQISLDMSEKECFVFADKTQIMRVLNNLLKNAVQAIPEEQPGIIQIQLVATSTTAIITVKDNGTGIPEEQADDIFVPNFTTKSSGTGIGLAMSQKIVEMAKGRIYFESEVGKGTDFIVELPLIEEATVI
jgi:signal transduction histidine kinase